MSSARLRVALAASLFAGPLLAQDQAPDATVAINESQNDCTAGGGARPAHTIMDDDPQSPGSDWCAMDNSPAVNNVITLGFTDPSCTLDTTTNAQTFRLYVRRDALNGSGGNDPAVQLNAYDNGVLIETGASNTVTNLAGELFTEAWTSNTTSSGAIEVQVDCSRSGGSPGSRRSCDFESVEWGAACVVGGGSRRVVLVRANG